MRALVLALAILALLGAQSAESASYDEAAARVFKVLEKTGLCGLGMDTPNSGEPTVGSGFFIRSHEDTGRYRLFVVTARHVVENRSADTYAPIRANNGIRFLYLERSQWIFHKSGVQPFLPRKNRPLFPVDVAILPIDDPGPGEISAFDYCAGQCPDRVVNELGSAHETMTTAAFLGFDPRDVPTNVFDPFVRSGVIAYGQYNGRIDGREPEDAGLFLIDAVTFGGYSGGPVIPFGSPQGSNNLIGLVTARAGGNRDYTVATPVSSVLATIQLARQRPPVSAWIPDPPDLSLKCTTTR